MSFRVVYENENLLVIDKPAGISADKELMPELARELPELKRVGSHPRYGLIHRLDKDTSGILLIAKDNGALSFFQKQFKQRRVRKKYLALVCGKIKENEGIIRTLVGRGEGKNKIKQKAYLPAGPESKKPGPRMAETQWRVLKRYKEYTLVEAAPRTGRKHQIRVHLAYLGRPIAGDKLYSFKNQSSPQGLNRQFLHASELEINLLNGEKRSFASELPKELKQILKRL